ncbi:hypothetical protein [Soonwooa sp.]|uniref:hypothetical protein n=1 Tax=Soonwooa sp. TaxID=1938592 RepID=UPI0028B0557A|nr:hypothetical protein [Soonwooa sp.]
MKLSRIFKFFIFSLLFATISVFGNSNVSKTPDSILYAEDTIVPEFCQHSDNEQDIFSGNRTVPKVSKKIIYLENFYFDFLEVESDYNLTFLTNDSPRLHCGVKSFLHLLQLY